MIIFGQNLTIPAIVQRERRRRRAVQILVTQQTSGQTCNLPSVCHKILDKFKINLFFFILLPSKCEIGLLFYGLSKINSIPSREGGRFNPFINVCTTNFSDLLSALNCIQSVNNRVVMQRLEICSYRPVIFVHG